MTLEELKEKIERLEAFIELKNAVFPYLEDGGNIEYPNPEKIDGVAQFLIAQKRELELDDVDICKTLKYIEIRNRVFPRFNANFLRDGLYISAGPDSEDEMRRAHIFLDEMLFGEGHESIDFIFACREENAKIPEKEFEVYYYPGQHGNITVALDEKSGGVADGVQKYQLSVTKTDKGADKTKKLSVCVLTKMKDGYAAALSQKGLDLLYEAFLEARQSANVLTHCKSGLGRSAEILLAFQWWKMDFCHDLPAPLSFEEPILDDVDVLVSRVMEDVNYYRTKRLGFISDQDQLKQALDLLVNMMARDLNAELKKIQDSQQDCSKESTLLCRDSFFSGGQSEEDLEEIREFARISMSPSDYLARRIEAIIRSESVFPLDDEGFVSYPFAPVREESEGSEMEWGL